MPKVSIDSEKCDGCSSCVSCCPMCIFEMKDGKAVVKDDIECAGCCACEAVCPKGAIKVEF